MTIQANIHPCREFSLDVQMSAELCIYGNCVVILYCSVVSETAAAELHRERKSVVLLCTTQHGTVHIEWSL